MSVLKNLRTCSFCSETIKDDGIFVHIESGILKNRWLCCSKRCADRLRDYAKLADSQMAIKWMKDNDKKGEING